MDYSNLSDEQLLKLAKDNGFAEEVSKKIRSTSSREGGVQDPKSAPNINKEYKQIQKIKKETNIISDFKFDDFTIKELDFKTTKEFIKKNHYSHRLASSMKMSLGFFYDNKLVTAIVYGCPVGRYVTKMLNVDYTNCLELVRVFSSDILPKNTESYCLAKSFRLLKSNYSNYKYLISYADPNHGHVGYIYQATNWFYIGLNSKDGHPTILIDGKDIHPKTLYSKHGTQSIPKMREIYGDRLETKEKLQKHIYILCLGNKKEKRLWYSKFKQLPYPKILVDTNA